MKTINVEQSRYDGDLIARLTEITAKTVREGDRVLIRERIADGQADHYYSSVAQTDNPLAYSSERVKSIYLLQRAPVEIPAEDGVYLGRAGKLLTVKETSDGARYYLGTEQVIARSAVSQYAPYRLMMTADQWREKEGK